MLHVVCAAIMIRDGCILLTKRSATRRWFPGVWGLPGGHHESGETLDQTLKRELSEELGIEITA